VFVRVREFAAAGTVFFCALGPVHAAPGIQQSASASGAVSMSASATPSVVTGTLTVVDKSDQAPWWLTPILTAALGLLATMTVVFQIGRQRRNELELQAENYRNELRLEVYREFSEFLKTTADPIAKAGTYCLTAASAADIARKMDMTLFVLEQRGEEFSELHHVVSGQAADVLMLIEKYLIIDPDLDLFKWAINSAVHDIGRVFVPLHNHLLITFPMGGRSGKPGPFNVGPVSTEETAKLRTLAHQYHSAMTTLSAYYDDLLVELQARLLGKLFPNTVPRREPLDPAQVVVTLNDPVKVAELKRHFRTQTAWGKHVDETQRQARDAQQDQG
jgi:hypothetical protein